ncbi:NADP-dependent oxidoreductase [Rhizobium sp. Rhizsp42]|uniref:NADP-dependent oxidoreductase n=1 Tax=Rhizobium sp. Rhizsp42 TaxID=3243034 RepID=UPI0039B05FE2
MSGIDATQIVLASRPDGRPTTDNFRLETTSLPAISPGQLLLRTDYLSLDPYMRGRMSGAKSYAEPTPVGGLMEGSGVATVLESKHPDFREGDVVLARTGWRTHAVSDAAGLRKLDDTLAPVTTALGVLGMPGFTAYSGMKMIGKPKQGDTVVVAAASGPVGSLVGQIAKRAGARSVGIAGGKEKCAFAKSMFGFDEVVDHKSADFAQQLAEVCPKGIDVYFENVGGAVWQAVLPLLNTYARVPVCGLISQYNSFPAGDSQALLAQTMHTVLARSLTLRGYINSEFAGELYPSFLGEIGGAVASGEIRYREDFIDGLENAPVGLIGLLEGNNFGKLIVRVNVR